MNQFGLDLGDYLLTKGWEKVNNKRDYYNIFVKKVDGQVIEEVIVSLDEDVPDFQRVMDETIVKICKIENISYSQLFGEMFKILFTKYDIE